MEAATANRWKHPVSFPGGEHPGSLLTIADTAPQRRVSMKPTFVPLAAFLAALLIPNAGAAPAFASQPPTRPLPAASDRPVGEGPVRFVDSAKGDDAGDGGSSRPWRTLRHAIKQLIPGDSLCLRGGLYRERVTITASGTEEKPIIIRGHPGELAILDGGLAEFFDNPGDAWEPCPDGVEGEFWSRKTYPLPGSRADATNLLGRFADSMVPLHGYQTLGDLRSKNEYWNLASKSDNEQTIYCGPGVFHDTVTGRIHCRLAHTTLEALGADNYRGETDPRKLPLVIAGHAGGPTLALRGARWLRLQDLVMRGARDATVDVFDSDNIELDGLTVYGGSSAIRAMDTRGLRVMNTACRGIAAPWTFRGSLKYRAIEARIFTTSGWSPTGADNCDFELAWSEFTDSVDGVFVGNARGVWLHHNLLDNISDDGIFLTAGTAFDGSTPGGDLHIYENLLSRCLTTFAFGVGHGRQRAVADGRQTGAGVTVCRNVFDFRRPVMYGIPQTPEEKSLTSFGRIAGDHGSPTWEPMTFFHNTVIAGDASFRSHYGGGLGASMGGGARRRVFNNIFLCAQGLPGDVLPEKAVDLHADGNLHWSATEGAAFGGDFFAKLRASKMGAESRAIYPPGWAANDLFTDPKFASFSPDWRQPIDLRLASESPAVDSGLTLPEAWADPLRTSDKGKPDRGALPLGAEPWRVGVRGRLTVLGGEAEPLPREAAIATLRPWPAGDSPPQTAQRAAIIEGYPAFDAPILHFALRRQRVPVEGFERTWLDPREWGRFSLVAIVGDLARAKMEPSKFGKDDLPHVREFLDKGGTLLLMRGTTAVFSAPDGRDFLDEIVGRRGVGGGMKLELRAPGHPWLRHLDPAAPRTWLVAKNSAALAATKGESLIGTPDGLSILHRVTVGRGQIIYIGWEIAHSLPQGRLPSTVEQENSFEEQVRVLLNIQEKPFPAPTLHR
jgi:hypothetical protein